MKILEVANICYGLKIRLSYLKKEGEVFEMRALIHTAGFTLATS